MQISSRTRRRLLTWLGVTLFGAVAAYYYVSLVYLSDQPLRGSPWHGARAGLLIAGAVAGFEIFILDGKPGALMRRMSFQRLLVVRAFVDTCLVALLLSVNAWIGQLWGEAWADDAFRLYEFSQDMAFSFIAIALSLFVVQMRNLIGGRNLTSFLLGRYHRARHEERLFLMLDLVGSTPLAERLGNERFHAYLANVFFDIDAPIVDRGGEIYTYLGDAVLASWPLREPGSCQHAIDALLAVRAVLAARAKRYEAQFGSAPAMRAVLHGGSVVAGECGDSRRQITYLGDVLNTVSRLEGLGKVLGCQTLVAAGALEGVKLPIGVITHDLGAHTLKGVREPVHVLAIETVGRDAIAQAAQ